MKGKLFWQENLQKYMKSLYSGTAEELIEKVQEPKGEFVIVVEKSEVLKKNIFDSMTIEEHYKYYESLRIGEKGDYKTNCKR